jgi:hypothetical protein
MLDTNSNLDKTEALFGPAALRAVENRIAAETSFQDAANKDRCKFTDGGSVTARKRH